MVGHRNAVDIGRMAVTLLAVMLPLFIYCGTYYSLKKIMTDNELHELINELAAKVVEAKELRDEDYKKLELKLKIIPGEYKLSLTIAKPIKQFENGDTAEETDFPDEFDFVEDDEIKKLLKQNGSIKLNRDEVFHVSLEKKLKKGSTMTFNTGGVIN